MEEKLQKYLKTTYSKIKEKKNSKITIEDEFLLIKANSIGSALCGVAI